MKALVTDDSKTVRLLLSEMLEEAGFEVAHAADGQEALAFLSAHPDTDSVPTDWNMPKPTGLQFRTAVRADGLFSHVRVIMVTNDRDSANVRSAFRAGVDDYLLKPCTRISVREKLTDPGFPM
jgi:two-component system chemotaxis response regulator CheY